MRSKVVERFLRYVTFDTTANPSSETCPSSVGQMVFAKYLEEELRILGLDDVSVDDNGYLFATLKGNVEGVDTIGFIAHLDTAPDMSGENVKPQIIENYDGKDIVLNKELNIVLATKDSSELLNFVGEDLITTDGTTLLGADDKAGIAEIVTAVEYLISNPEIKHGDIRIGFTPDEEIVIVAAAALKFSYSSSPIVLPSIVYAYLAPNFSTSNLSAPLPISSSGVNPILMSPCFISGLFIKYSIAVTISATPALSSAPSNVVPSVVIKSSPTKFNNSEESLVASTIFNSLFNTISFPS